VITLREHTLTIRPNSEAHRSPYDFEVVCSCQWQALATTQKSAQDFVRLHQHRHGVKLTEFPVEVVSGE
jgi:hypothetical protein